MLERTGDKRRVLFMRNVAGVMTIIGRAKAKSTQDKILFKHEPYPIDILKPAYRRKNIFVYVIDTDNPGSQLSLQGIYDDKNIVNKILWDQIFRREIIRQLVSSLMTPGLSAPLIVILLSLLGGFGIGFIVKSLMG